MEELIALQPKRDLDFLNAILAMIPTRRIFQIFLTKVFNFRSSSISDSICHPNLMHTMVVQRVVDKVEIPLYE